MRQEIFLIMIHSSVLLSFLLLSTKVLVKSSFAGVFKRKGANAPANESASLLPSARIAA